MFREGHQAQLTFHTRAGDVAYAESLLAVEYIRSSYGMNGVQRILWELAEGDRGEDAVRSVTMKNYDQLEREIGEYLLKTYGQ